MTPDQASEFAGRINAAIDRLAVFGPLLHDVNLAADRERVESDLAGLRECWLPDGGDRWFLKGYDHDRHATRYADGLRRTGSLYGVTP